MDLVFTVFIVVVVLGLSLLWVFADDIEEYLKSYVAGPDIPPSADHFPRSGWDL